VVVNTITFTNEFARGRVRIEKIGPHIVGFESYHHIELGHEEGVHSVMKEIDFSHPNIQTAVLDHTWNWVRELLGLRVNAISNPPHLTGGLEQTSRQGIRWQLEDSPLAGVRFEIYAREDIVLPNDVIVHTAGSFIGSYLTDANGQIESSNLFLGRYFIREIEAPNGFFIDDIEFDFELAFENEYTAIVFNEIQIHNQLQEVKICLVKVGEVFEDATGWSEEVMLLEGVQFGLFAAEDFVFSNGQVLEADTLIEDGYTDEFGELVFNTYLPNGLFYIQEMAVREFYVLDDTRYYFEFVGDHQNERLIIFEINNLEPIRNEFVRGSFEITKLSRALPFEYTDQKDTEIENPVLLPDVEFELWLLDPLHAHSDEKSYVGTFITDENGHILVDNLIFGNYMLVEVVTHYRHQLLSESIFFTISYHHEHHQFVVENDQTQVQILKVDDLGEPLAGAHFQLLMYETEEVIHEWISAEYAEIIFALAHGDYILREVEAPIGFLLGEDIHFSVTDAEGTIYIIAENVLDSHVYIATQAHTGNGNNQYFTSGEVVNMFDDIEITHVNIRPGSRRAFRAYLFARLPNGAVRQVWYTNHIEYSVEYILDFNINEPNIKNVQVNTTIDTSQFPNDTEFFWAGTAYRQVVNEDGYYIWEEDYSHNFDGSDMRQTIFPNERSLPQTSTRSSSLLWFKISMLGIGGSLVVYKKKNMKNT